MRAYGKWILVEEINETVTASGLEIVQKDSSLTILKGKVVSVGQDVKADINVGDTIVADRYAGSAYNDHIFVSEDEVVAVLTDA